MKKSYTKPEIVFESFVMSTNIAAGCDYFPNHAYMQCAYEIKDKYGDTSVIFVDGVCSSVQPDGYNGFCYHEPTPTTNLFNS